MSLWTIRNKNGHLLHRCVGETRKDAWEVFLDCTVDKWYGLKCCEGRPRWRDNTPEFWESQGYSAVEIEDLKEITPARERAGDAN